MFVLRWILGHPIVSILIFCGLLAVANWGTLYGPGTDAAHVASEEHSGEVHGDAAPQQMDEKAELASTDGVNSAESVQVAGTADVVSGDGHIAEVTAAKSAQVAPQSVSPIAGTVEQGSVAAQESVASGSEDASNGASSAAAAVAATADSGAKSLFDFFKGEKKPTAEAVAPSEASVASAQSPQVEDVTGDDGKKSVFDFFKKDKEESVEVASVDVEKAAEAVTEQSVEAVAEEKKPFLQIVKEEPVAEASAPAVGSEQVSQAPAAVVGTAAAPAEPAAAPEMPAAPEVPAQPAAPAPVALVEATAPQADVPVESPAPEAGAPVEAPVVETVAVVEAPAEKPASVKQAPAVVAPEMAPAPALRAPQPAPLPSAQEAFKGSLLYARRAFWDNQYEAAYATYRNLVSAHPNNPDLLGEFGNLLVQMGRTEEAVGVYEHAAQILISRGRFKEAHPLVGYIGSVDKQRAMQLVEKIRNAR